MLDLRWGTVAELEASQAFLDAPTSAAAKQTYLAAYRQALRDLKQAPAASVLPVLRRLWELNRVSMATRLSAAEVREGVGLTAAKAPPAYHSPAAVHSQQKSWRLASPATFDADVRKLLRATKNSQGTPYTEVVGRWVRYIVDVQEKNLLDPNLPMVCEGIADPLVGTAFIMEIHPITGRRRPVWKIAAALVHEAEHARWFYEKAGRDPRLLFAVPNERNACRAMFLFLRDVRQSGAAGAEGQAIVEDMQAWRETIRTANGVLGYATDDLSVRTDLNVTDEVLMADPGCPLPVDTPGSGPR